MRILPFLSHFLLTSARKQKLISFTYIGFFSCLPIKDHMVIEFSVTACTRLFLFPPLVVTSVIIAVCLFLSF